MHKAIPAALLTTVAVAIPAGIIITRHAPGGNGAAPTAAPSTATPVPQATPTTQGTIPTPKHTARTEAQTYVGPSTDMQWGPVQVTIVVRGNAVTDLSATAPTERARSAYINNIAVPMLRQEVLQAKTVANIKNIYAVSGATLTSDAFYQSLLAALTQAHMA